MKRFKKRIFIIFVLSLMLLTACTTNSSQEENGFPDKPNVILILADDLGYGDLSCFGQQTLQTPNIDKMAGEGMVFTNFYTGSTVCAPSRASLLTGKHTGHASVRGNLPDQLVNDNELTIARVMKNAGYKTGAIGKWGVGHPPLADDSQRKGFDYFYGYINMVHAHNCYPEFLYENGKKVYLENKLKTINGENPWADMPEGAGVSEIKKDYAPFLFDDKAIDFIERNKDNKFFLYLAYNIPHTNNEAKPNGMEVPTYGEFECKHWPDTEKGFATMMRILDDSMGKIIQKLKELGIDNNTMIIFCSDNGPHQEGGHLVSYFDSNGEYRGMKRDLYDGGVRTPFIVRWPGVIKAGTKSSHLAAFWDVLPAFAELTDMKEFPETDGISFLPTLLGEESLQEKHDYLYWEFFEQGGKQAIVKDNWKLIKLNVRNQSKPVIVELYNIATDVEEQTNVANEHPDIVAEMEKLLKEARVEFSVVP